MRKKALLKDFFMEIRTSLNRFLSIFFIVALGVAFFSGIRASEPDMRYSGDEYFDEHEMMDIKVLSTLGITDKDLEAIRAVDGVENVEAGYMYDALSLLNESERVVRIESLLPSMNRVDVIEGRLPEKSGEIIVDADQAAEFHIKVGDVLHMRSGKKDQNLSDTLSTDTFTVVGTCASPIYISFERGSTNIGSGSVNMFAYVTDESFSQEVYTQAWVSAAGAKEETAFTDDYIKRVDAVKKKIEDIADVQCEVRYDDIMDEAGGEIESAESELADAKTEAESEFSKAESELNDAESQLASGKTELENGRTELADARNQLSASRGTLDSGWNDYYAGASELENGRNAIAAAETEIASKEALIVDGENQLAAAETEIAANEAAVVEAENGIAQAKQLIDGLDTGWAQYESGTEQLDQMKSAFSGLQMIIDSGGQLTEEQQMLYAELQAQIPIVQQQVDEAKAQLDQMEAMRPAAEEALAHEAEVIEARSQLEAGKVELAAKKQELADGRAQLEAGKAELEAQRQNLSAAENELYNAGVKLNDGEEQYKDGLAKAASGEADLIAAEQTIKDNEQKLADGWEEYHTQKADADAEIADAEAEIADAREDLKAVEKPVWYVDDRDSYVDYSGYSENADRMRAIGEVFPILFFLVAALVSLTTMTRMVEEERTQIGTLKALGYSKLAIAGKYMGYALLATVTGSIVGVLIGQKIFPYIIVTAYQIVYPHIPNIVIPYHLGYSLAAGAAAIACTMAATIFACGRELVAQPAELMRPEAPKVGKRVLLERIPFIWKHLNFTWKSTIRNLMRYKKRFFMTVFGIGGCMALMLVGYGLKDSIVDIAVYQYGRIQTYDIMTLIDEEIGEDEKAELDQLLAKDERVSGFMDGYMKNTDITHGEEKMDLYVYVPSTLENLDQFVRFNYRKSGETFKLGEKDAVLTEKAAKMLGVSKGDTVQVKLDENRTVDVTITDICENYLEHYLYIAPQLYEELTGEEAEYNCIFTCIDDAYTDDLEAVGQDFLNHNGILSVMYTNNMEQRLEDMIGTLDDVIIVLIISAGMLAFVVLYNLNNININERKRELATLKVLGFYDGEVAAYVFRENVLLTLIGALAGVFIGKFLHLFVIQTVEVEICMFGRNIDFSSFVFSILFILLFSFTVNAVMYFKLKKINMVESLKSVE